MSVLPGISNACVWLGCERIASFSWLHLDTKTYLFYLGGARYHVVRTTYLNERPEEKPMLIFLLRGR